MHVVFIIRNCRHQNCAYCLVDPKVRWCLPLGPKLGSPLEKFAKFYRALNDTKKIIVIIVPTSVSSLFEPQSKSIDFHPWGNIRESVPSLKNDCFEKNQSNCGGATCPTRSKLDQNTLFQKSHPLFSSKIVDCCGTDKTTNSNVN